MRRDGPDFSPPKEPVIIIVPRRAATIVPARRSVLCAIRRTPATLHCRIPEIATICGRFEAELRAGKKPKIEDFLGDMPEPGAFCPAS